MIELHFGPSSSRGAHTAGYRIGRNQSATMRAIYNPPRPSESAPGQNENYTIAVVCQLSPDADIPLCRLPGLRR
jgi:hypothetical protein